MEIMVYVYSHIAWRLVGTIRFTYEAMPKQVPFAILQVESVGLHNKTFVAPVVLQWTSDSPTYSHSL